MDNNKEVQFFWSGEGQYACLLALPHLLVWRKVTGNVLVAVRVPSVERAKMIADEIVILEE